MADVEASLPGALHLEVLCTWDLSVRQVRRWGTGEGGGDSAVAVGPSCLAAHEEIAILHSIRRSLGSISSAASGKWAQPSPGPLQLLLMNLLSELPTFLYANYAFMGPLAIRTH